MNRKIFLVGALLFACLSSSAWAAPRTVCYRMQLADERTNCPSASEAGALRACNAGGYSDAVGHHVELWDKDADGADEYIGTWYIGGAGTRCVGFEWENAGYSKGETNPDVYLRYINTVVRTGYVNYTTVKAVRSDGADHPVTWWRNGDAGAPDRFVALNCAAGTTCYVYPSGSLVPSNDRASERAQRVMALDSAQHTLQVLGEQMDRQVRLHYPGKADCPTSCATDRAGFHISGTQGDNGVLVGHELGHVIQMQRFGQDNLVDDVGKSGAGWNLTSDEYDSGATTEGFASYVGLVSWYEPNRFDTVPIGWGLNFEAATPFSATCSANRGIPLQVAKAFWDVDDWNNEAGAGAASGWNDAVRYATADIVTGWDLFGNGSANRQNDESDRDGVNVRDYHENTRGRFVAAGFFTTLVEHNCLQNQTTD